MSTKHSKPKPSLEPFYQNPQTAEVCSMICETGANQLVTRCSDCNKIHASEITREDILKNPLHPLITSPKLVSEVCVRGLLYELALAEKQLEEASWVLAEVPFGLWDQICFSGAISSKEQKVISEGYDRLKTALAPKQSKIKPGELPVWDIDPQDPAEDPKEGSDVKA